MTIAAASAIAAVLVAATVRPAHAQDTIITDRPGLAFSPSLVPVGDIQVELGLPAVERTLDGDGHYRLVNFPALLRAGVMTNLELRVCAPLYNLARDGADSSEGFGPVELGTKIGVPTTGASPELAVIPSIVLPIGHDEFAGDGVGFALNGVAGWSLPAELDLTTVTGVLVEPITDDDDDYQTTLSLVGAVGRSLTDRFGAYAEAGWFPTWGVASAAFLGGGMTFLLTDTLQVDAYFDRGLNSAATDWLFGTGISARF